MKQYIRHNIGNYSLNVATKDITVTGVNIDASLINEIVNLTTNQVIYVKDSLGNCYVGKTITIANNVINFAVDNSLMNDDDDIGIIINIDFSKYKLLDLVNDFIQSKHIHDINYITEIKSGVNIDKEHDFTDDGFLSVTRFYKDYVDENDKGELILQVEETYVTNPDHSLRDPTSREVESRNKKRKYIKSDGSVDETYYKETDKKYKERTSKSKEGFRRRNNVIDKMSQYVATAGIVSGLFIDEDDAFNNLSTLLEAHSSAYITWLKTARGTLLADVLADSTSTWLDNVVVDNSSSQAMVSWMIGMTYRSYIIEKLKGKIK